VCAAKKLSVRYLYLRITLAIPTQWAICALPHRGGFSQQLP
jgi:hypothetical protein